MKRLSVLVLLVLTGTASAYLPPQPGKTLKRNFGIPLVPMDNHDSTHAYDIRRYDVDLNLAMYNSGFSGHERVTVTSRLAGLDTIALHMVDLTCDSVRLNGAPLTFTTPSGLLLVNLDRAYEPGESLVLHIFYRKPAGTRQQGFYWYARSGDTPHNLAYTTTEPADTRYWMPCFDWPWDKAEQGCQLNFTVPDSFTVASNGLLDSVTVPGPGLKKFWWQHRYPISTYLMTFGASRWWEQKQRFQTAPGESSFIHNFVWPEDSIYARSSFRNMVDMMDFFSAPDRYGPYPFEKYGQVEAYPFQWGGMENQTMTTIHHWWVRYGDDGGIAHELSHQWWGDMVTCLDWREIWLNEGFATYSDAQYEHHQNGRAAFLSLMNQRANSYFDEEARDLHPIWNPPYPDHLFDWGHSYCKGSWVQHMLRYVLGDTVFTSPGILFQAMRTYGDSFKYGNANTEDYCRIVEQVTGQELSWFFDEWVYQAGYPRYTINWRSTGSGPYQVVMDISQSNGAQAPTCFHMPLQLQLRGSGWDTTVAIPIVSNPQGVEFTVSHNVTSLVSDPNSWLLDRTTLHVGIENATARELAEPLAVTPTLLRNSAAVRYTIPRAGPIELAVYDAGGRRVRTLVAGEPGLGTHHTRWDGTGDAGARLAPGVYFLRLTGSELEQRVKVVVGR